MVVVSIISTLALTMVPNYQKALARARYVACARNAIAVATALEIYAMDHNSRYPQELKQLVSEGYLRELPKCPSVKEETFSKAYSSAMNPDYFFFCCYGENHKGTQTFANSPAYSLDCGLAQTPELVAERVAQKTEEPSGKEEVALRPEKKKDPVRKKQTPTRVSLRDQLFAFLLR